MTEIQLKNRGPIAEIILDGPESRNALDADNLRDIAAAVAKVAEAVPNVRVLLIRGEGKVFCSGRDIANVDVETDDAHAFLADIFAPVFRAIRALPIPVIAQVQGAALGSGTGSPRPRTSSSPPMMRSSGPRSPRSARCSIRAPTTCSWTGSAITGRWTSSSPVIS